MRRQRNQVGRDMIYDEMRGGMEAKGMLRRRGSPVGIAWPHILFSLGIFAMLPTAEMSSEGWTSIGPPGGHHIDSIMIDPTQSDTVFAYSNTGVGWESVLYKSINGGTSWSAIDLRLQSMEEISALLVDRGNPGRVFVGTTDRLLRSDDRGRHWKVLATKGFGLLTKGGDAGDRLFAARLDGVYSSDDAGESWTHRAIGLPPDAVTRVLAVSPHDSQVVFVGLGLVNMVIFKTTDGGDTWIPSSSGVDTTESIRSLAFDARDPNIMYAGMQDSVYVSRNGGRSWRRFTQTAPQGAVQIATHPMRKGVAYVARDGVYETIDSGRTWERVDSGIHWDDPQLGTLAIDPLRPDRLFAGSWAGIYLSGDGGRTWVPRMKGLKPSLEVTGIAVDPRESGALRIATSSGIWIGHGKGVGTRWEVANRGLPEGPLTALAAHPWLSRRLYAGSSYPGKRLYVTTDGGLHWRMTGLGPMNGDVRELAIDPFSPETIIASLSYDWEYGNGLFKSTDAGETWTRIDHWGSPTPFVTSIVFDPRRQGVVYAGLLYRGVWKSTNGGATWVQKSTGLGSQGVNALAVDPNRAGVLYAGIRGSGQAVFKTVDGGTTWRSCGVENLAVYDIVVDPNDSSVVYAAGIPVGPSAKPVYVSLDDGSTWRPVDDGLPSDAQVSTVVIDPSTNRGEVYLGTFGGSVYKWVRAEE